MNNEYLQIVPARGGYVLKYFEVPKLAEGDKVGAYQYEVTEVVATESKLIKRVREILATFAGTAEPEQLNG